MATALQDLVDKRASTWATAQDYDTRKKAGDELSAEDEAAWTRALDEVDRLGVEIENLERSAKLDSAFSEIDEKARREAALASTPADAKPAESDYVRAFDGYMRRGVSFLSAEDQQLLQRGYGDFDDPQTRALAASFGASGGYTVPEGFWAKVTEVQKYFGGAAEGADLITTTTGADLPWPTNDDTGNEGYILGENVEATNEADLQFGKKTLGAHTFVSGPAKVSLILLQDTGIDIEPFIAKKIGERIGRRRNRALTTGAGTVNEPQGYMTAGVVGKTTASGTAITYNELIDLEHSVDAAYRGTGRCQYKFNDLILAYLRKVRDDSGGAGVGRPLWQPSVQAGVPDTFNGYRYTINNDMDSTVATTKKTVAFGDFEAGFAVRTVLGAQMLRLAERYAENLQVAFLAFERHDSIVQDASAYKVLQQA